MSLIERMRERLFEVIDENNPYSQEDFDKEFSTNTFDFEGSKLNLLFSNKSTNPNPEYATDGSSGFDLRANLESSIIMKPFKRAIIPTGLYFEIPDNLEIQVRSRSGLAVRNGITILTGTVDADYRGEVRVILINLGEEDFIINHGDRIAQAIVAPVISKKLIDLTEIENVEENTNRGTNGFGSTGHK
jgi:dUTP pyrophosphatase